MYIKLRSIHTHLVCLSLYKIGNAWLPFYIRSIWPFKCLFIRLRLDYCNRLLTAPLVPLIYCKCSKNRSPQFSYITCSLPSLYWLPVTAHIKYKTCLPKKPKMDPTPTPKNKLQFTTHSFLRLTRLNSNHHLSSYKKRHASGLYVLALRV